jgi:hypothetical protein
MACMRLSPIISTFETPAMQPLFTAQRATLAAAPGSPKHKVQHVWFNFSPHLPAQSLSLASHPLAALHFEY